REGTFYPLQEMNTSCFHQTCLRINVSNSFLNHIVLSSDKYPGNSQLWRGIFVVVEKIGRWYSRAMHTVAILALDGVVAFDLSTPIEVFGRTYLSNGRAAYQVRICAPTDEI